MDFLLALPLAMLGWLLGGLINYLSDVLPVTRRLSPARCPACDKAFSAVDYLLLRPCAGCTQRRRLRAWVVQLLGAAAAVGLWFYPLGKLGFWVGLVVLTYFGVVAVIDLEHRLILHPTSLVGALIGVGVGVWRHGWLATLAGGAAGFGIMLALFYLGYLFAKGIGKLRKQEVDEDALGFGDVMLGGVLGLLLGWPGITAGLTLAILLGGAGGLLVIGYMAATKKYQALMAIPYGPFLIAAAVVLLFRG